MRASTGRSRSSSAQNPWIVLMWASSSLVSAASSRPRACSACDGGPLAIEPFAQSQLEFARGLLREGDGDNLVDRGASFREDPHDPAHELGRLAGAGGGFDDQRLVERGRDQVPRACRVRPCISEPEPWRAEAGSAVIVRAKAAHGIPRSDVRSPIDSAGLRRRCSGSSGPQTGRKSHQVQARSAGAGGRNPSSMARSMISSASRPARRLASDSGTG